MAQKTYYGGLDLIRFAAAAMVLVFHVCFWSWANPGSSSFALSGNVLQLPSVGSITWSGWIGVEIFFVISGFVIVQSAEKCRGVVCLLFPSSQAKSAGTRDLDMCNNFSRHCFTRWRNPLEMGAL
jgi:hypothetical protein